MKPIKCRIKERSLIARIAAAKLRSRQVAIVIGKTIHLHNTDTASFMANSRWVRHEIAHVKQFQKYGFIRFLVMYLLESVNNGYHRNKYEVEARAAEADPDMTTGILIRGFVETPGQL